MQRPAQRCIPGCPRGGLELPARSTDTLRTPAVEVTTQRPALEAPCVDPAPPCCRAGTPWARMPQSHPSPSFLQGQDPLGQDASIPSQPLLPTGPGPPGPRMLNPTPGPSRSSDLESLLHGKGPSRSVPGDHGRGDLLMDPSLLLSSTDVLSLSQMPSAGRAAHSQAPAHHRLGAGAHGPARGGERRLLTYL